MRRYIEEKKLEIPYFARVLDLRFFFLASCQSLGFHREACGLRGTKESQRSKGCMGHRDKNRNPCTFANVACVCDLYLSKETERGEVA